MQKVDVIQSTTSVSAYESPRLATYGDMKRITKGQLTTSGDTTAGFKP